MKINYVVVILVASLVVGACGGGSDSTQAPVVESVYTCTDADSLDVMYFTKSRQGLNPPNSTQLFVSEAISGQREVTFEPQMQGRTFKERCSLRHVVNGDSSIVVRASYVLEGDTTASYIDISMPFTPGLNDKIGLWRDEVYEYTQVHRHHTYEHQNHVVATIIDLAPY